jgi:protein SCO1
MLDNRTILQGWTFLLVMPVLISGLFFGLYFYFPKILDRTNKSALAETTSIAEPRRLEDFSLVDHHGHIFDNQRLQGHWTFMNFGCTHCPDTCSTTLSAMSEVSSRLHALAKHAPFQVVFVSIDPARDTLARLSEYVTNFDADFLGVTGTESDLPRLTHPLGIPYHPMGTRNNSMDFAVDHTASIILIDPQGRFFADFLPPYTPETIVQDFLAITHQG